MGFNQHYYAAFNLVYTKVSGVVDNQQVSDHIQTMHVEDNPAGIFNEIVDCLDVLDADQISVQGLFEAAELETAQEWTQHAKLAMIVPNVAHYYGLARAYVAVAQTHRVDTTILHTIEKGLEWFGYNDADKEKLKALITDLNRCAANKE